MQVIAIKQKANADFMQPLRSFNFILLFLHRHMQPV
jgi:hypothetical protein